MSPGRAGVGPPDATALTEGMVERVQRRLVQERADPTSTAVARALRAELPVLVSDAEMVGLIRGVQRELVGTGPLADLLADPATTDVVVNGPRDVRVDRGNGWEATTVTFADEAAVQRLARRLAATAGRRLDDARPFVDAQLPDGARLHAVLAPVATGGTCLSLRVLRPVRHDLTTLERSGGLPGVTAPAIAAIVRARLAFLVSGGTGSGKTTLLGAMIGSVAPADRVVVVEDAAELAPPHPHVLHMVARPANVEGVGAVLLRDLVRQALRMRPDRIVVGEVRGDEVVDLLAALNTGHEGGAGTVHANTAADVPQRIEALAAAAGLPRAAAHAQLGAAVQVVLHLTRRGSRRVLGEIAVLQRDADGLVTARPAVVDGLPVEPGASLLAAVLRQREVAAPW
ncbi:TadA family conjugal transfer-associated ATPase [Nakamurella flavida]|uniref:TadA family conjugal transfer-associated ATPase n=1 Tax=Nakamurella flavida TaxID=363630 RepID=A0A938YKK7_9ACTN|nr:TadA family conjugal transfer-associated ATPase [Nakamurella flavida]MBM9476261.1 TadA family conjugal transfer-associated ATPase [Nakamurella flavida]MDP9779641.1 pilus assembly protein CpaF [Nakamurella flavida]